MILLPPMRLTLKHLNNHTYITSQKTPNLPLNSDKLDEIKANLMAKSFFMNEIYELKNEISLLRSLSDGNESKEPKNSHSINVLEIKLVFLERKIQFFVQSLKINTKQSIRF